MLAKGVGGMSRILAAFLVVAAAAVLVGSARSSGPVAAAAVSGAIIAVWGVGSAGRRDCRRAKWRGRLGQAASVGFALSLGAGALLAAGLVDGAGWFGLPRSLWGLLLGVWLAPLFVTGLGFAAAFEPPDPAALERLRAGSRDGP